MSRTFDIALGTAGLVVAVGLVGWGLVTALRRSYDPGKMVIKIAVTIPLVLGCLWVAHKLGPFGPFVIVFMAVVISYMWTPHIAEVITNPLTSWFDGGNEAPEARPFYSIANTKRGRGEYPAAVAEVRKQLERFPNDFEGVMLLAAIHAENLNDLVGAENVLNHFCEVKNVPDKQVAAAWTALADWHLKIGLDTDAARAALDRIIARFPETELALKAEQRLAHLAGTEKILLEQHDRPRIAVPKGVHNLGLRDDSSVIRPAEIEPGKLAAAYVKQLEAHPHDSEVREKLAALYARDFQRLDLATLELMQLINEKRHSAKQIAGWLNMLANFQVELGADLATVRATLERIVNDYPDLPIAEVTKRRLVRLEGEFRAKEKTPGVKLGVYEQNIGLKYGSPRKL